MKVAIIAVGTELLFGQTVNTNATYLSNKLNLMGFDVMYHYVVGDNPKRLEEILGEAFDKVDLVITTGGLGPTQDDLTKEIVSEFMGAKLYTDESVVKELHDFFDARGRKMTDNNKKQALLPEGCTVFHNNAGTAPAFALEKDGKCAICLPGPPREMTHLFETLVYDFLQKFLSKKMYYRVVRTIGIGESDFEDMLLPLIDGQTDPTLATYAKEGECTLRIASQRDTMEEAKQAVDEMLVKVVEICGEYIYSVDDEEISEVIVKELKRLGLTLASAESCTGGLFSASITDVPGASDVFKYGYVTYSEEAKISALGVSEETIDKYSVVSSQVAEEMAEKLKKISGADIAISITGYAGPLADEGRECGEAYIGVAYKDVVSSRLVQTHTDRRGWNRGIFRLNMMKTVYSILKSDFSA